MQVLLMMWLLLAGMKAGLWEAVEGASAPARTTETEVVAAEGPFNPPPRP
jgi:hypothetical protein